MIKWLVGLAVAGIIVLTGVKLLPVYVNNHALKKIAQQVVSDQELKSRPKREVLGQLKSAFMENNLGHLDPKEVVKVARDSNGNLVLDVKYEERRKLMYNIELVAGFDEQFTN
ncbi:MAG: DUF4845 domain-containing protein [Pseudomonadota bacterium]